MSLTETFRPHKDAAYWDRGVRNVPDMTGARHLLDAHDLRAVLTTLGCELPLADVLDVGCGTGRLAQLCEAYMGADIAQSCVDYCLQKGIPARRIAGPDDLIKLAHPYAFVTAISVFTHVDQDERRAYLEAFARVAREIVVDIIPGDGSGSTAVWTAEPAAFQQLLFDVGWRVTAFTDHQWDDHVHRYYRARLGQ